MKLSVKKKHISLKILHGNIQWNEAYWSGRRKGSNTYPQSYMLYNVLKKVTECKKVFCHLLLFCCTLIEYILKPLKAACNSSSQIHSIRGCNICDIWSSHFDFLTHFDKYIDIIEMCWWNSQKST